MICPYCEQGMVIMVKIKKSNKVIHLCEECDTVWEGEIDLQTGIGFDAYMEKEGCEASWEELLIDD